MGSQLSRTAQSSIGIPTTCFAYPFAGCRGVDEEIRPTPSHCSAVSTMGSPRVITTVCS